MNNQRDPDNSSSDCSDNNEKTNFKPLYVTLPLSKCQLIWLYFFQSATQLSFVSKKTSWDHMQGGVGLVELGSFWWDWNTKFVKL